jgi:hypothetical protein
MYLPSWSIKPVSTCKLITHAYIFTGAVVRLGVSEVAEAALEEVGVEDLGAAAGEAKTDRQTCRWFGPSFELLVLSYGSSVHIWHTMRGLKWRRNEGLHKSVMVHVKFRGNHASRVNCENKMLID